MINKIMNKIITDMLKDRKDRHGWNSGKFSKIMKLSADQRGEIGERLLESVLVKGGVSGVTRSGALDRTKKHWDIKTDDMNIEVKTATLGRNTNNFQHEGIEKDRDYDVLVFIDIAPNDIFMTWTLKADIMWKELHRRANSNFYKWNTKLSELEPCRVETADDILDQYNAIKNA